MRICGIAEEKRESGFGLTGVRAARQDEKVGDAVRREATSSVAKRRHKVAWGVSPKSTRDITRAAKRRQKSAGLVEKQRTGFSALIDDCFVTRILVGEDVDDPTGPLCRFDPKDQVAGGR